MAALTDNSLMPFGKYSGEKMGDVPASYLLWFKDEAKGKTIFQGSDNEKVLLYIEENLDVLEAEMDDEKPDWQD